MPARASRVALPCTPRRFSVFLLYLLAQATIIRMQAVPTPPLSQSTAGIVIGLLNGVLFTTLTFVSTLKVLARRATPTR